jgi:glutamyl-tRNA synthetase
VPVTDEKAAAKFFVAENEAVLRGLRDALATAEPWDKGTIEATMHAFMTEKSLEIKNVAQPARVALTGRSASPGLYEVMELLGKETSLARLGAAADACAKKASS